MPFPGVRETPRESYENQSIDRTLLDHFQLPTSHKPQMSLTIRGGTLDHPIPILRRTCSANGHAWSKLLKFLYIVSDSFDPIHYNLFQTTLIIKPYSTKTYHERTLIEQIPDLRLNEGTYILLPKDPSSTPIPKLLEKPVLPIVPKDPPPENSSEPSRKKRRTGSVSKTQHDDLHEALKNHQHSSTFQRETLSTRWPLPCVKELE